MTLLITWFDGDDFGDDFSIGVGGPAPESGFHEGVVKVILSERQKVQGTIVQLTIGKDMKYKFNYWKELQSHLATEG